MTSQKTPPMAVVITESVLFALGFQIFLCLSRLSMQYFLGDLVDNDRLWTTVVNGFSALMIPVSFRVLFGLLLMCKSSFDHMQIRYADQAKIRTTAILADPHFLLRLLPTLFLFLLVPVSFGYSALTALLFGAETPSALTAFFAVHGVYLPLCFLLALGAYRTSIRKAPAIREKCLKNPRYAKERRAKLTFFVTLSLFLSWALGPYLLMILVSIWNVLFAFLPILAAVFLVLFLIRFSRAVRIRKKLLGDLKALDRARRIHLGEIRHPYLSLLSPRFSLPFTVRADGKTYTCRLIASINRQKHIYFHENGKGYFIRHYHMPMFMPVVRTRTGARVVDIHDQGTLFRTEKAFHYGFKASGTKLLIVSPVPQELYAVKGTETLPLTPGDAVGDYKIYNAATFLSHLDLGILD